MSADLSQTLQEAHTIVANHLQQLCELAERTRRQGELLDAALRQEQRQLDEATVQHRMAVERHSFGASSLARRETDLRSRCDSLVDEIQTNQHALKQLEQLISQIEMSSGALTGVEENGNDDPWKLALRAQVIHGREEERLRLAREVHDGPAQVLANSLMLLETCHSQIQQQKFDRLPTALQRLRSAAQEGLVEVRRFIADLRPGKLEEYGLAVAIEDYVRNYTQAYGTRVKFETEDAPRLPIESEIVLYRIVQEALQNAHKYARQASIIIRILHRQGALHLSVRDDGPGFDVHEVARRTGRSSWGLMSMRERAELIGAQLTVASRPGHGTEVSITLTLT
ncbi:MAG: sensor histidine kinase [Chloroflexi bacterium AL-W]|nr:sensor histidine kinase [Chloroflexi bacterium AL-N1]NOK69394.1 sensor histidine kinase [Chloroflexi bacterium AL-N10]NOK76455.1 sensor histidine kinase [Chloroflexi bacterium AL-N5]NOK83572.1 sensor histidine kinase [Chloroflexi bacterium AL-W]NOK91232.1 sensor histidine kinase [Chloroflexi bacterium AL-N15]